MCIAVRKAMAEMARRIAAGNGMKAKKQQGFTYIALLIAVAIMGVSLAATALLWHTEAQRNKEQELLFAGHAIRNAIALYYERTPGTAKQYPKKLEDLLEDKRQAQLARYLRQVYRDPFTAKKDWGIVAGPGETIMGVYSLSKATPFKQANFDEPDKDFENKTSLQDWKFVYLPKQQAAPAAPTAGNQNNPAGAANPSGAPPLPLGVSPPAAAGGSPAASPGAPVSTK